MEPHGYFPNGNPDYETPWTRERNTGWIFLATAVITSMIYHYWAQHPVIMIIAATMWGSALPQLRLGIRGREQAETLQETEGQLDLAGFRFGVFYCPVELATKKQKANSTGQ